jgi:predicted nucleic acid-binding protein
MGLGLNQGDIVFLDTSPFIYFFERHPSFFPYTEALFDEVYEKDDRIITSVITFIEIATLPARRGDARLVEQYRNYFTNSRNIDLIPVDTQISEQAINLRSTYSFKTADAIQLATALVYRARYTITNDRQWKQVNENLVVMIDEITLAGT